MVWSRFPGLIGGQPWLPSSVVVHVGGLSFLNGISGCLVGQISLGVSLCSTVR